MAATLTHVGSNPTRPSKLARMRLPKTNRVHYRTYDITKEKQPMVEGSPCDGWMDKDGKGTICVKENLCPLSTCDVLLHEILHAICYEHGLKLPDEEETVRAMASALIQNILDNKETWRFICRHVK